jgi:hypothetical protein
MITVTRRALCLSVCRWVCVRLLRNGRKSHLRGFQPGIHPHGRGNLPRRRADGQPKAHPARFQPPARWNPENFDGHPERFLASLVKANCDRIKAVVIKPKDLAHPITDRIVSTLLPVADWDQMEREIQAGRLEKCAVVTLLPEEPR